MTEGFEGLVAAAQVGTRKAPPARATDFSLEGTERSLLLELGALGLMRRAGATPVAAAPLAPAPAETARIADAADVLEEALDESMPAAREWARAASARGLVAPSAVVSRLVALAAKHPEFRAVLGERGRWLAGVTGVALEAPEDDLPAREEWESLGPKERARLVADGPEDPALFEQALKDRRKEVREAAVERLIRMPASPQAQELRRLAEAAVRVEKGFLRATTLKVEPPAPEALPSWLPRAAPYSGFGAAAMALFDVVSHVPPGVWREPPDRLLDLARGTDYHQALGLAWQAAADRFDDGAWIDAFFPRMKTDRLPPRSAMLERASDAVVEATVTRWLGERDLAGVVHLLALRERPISPALSRAVVAAVARQGARPAGVGSLPYYLAPLGTLLDPSVLPLVEAGMGEPFAGVAEGWRKLLDLRRRLLESLR